MEHLAAPANGASQLSNTMQTVAERLTPEEREALRTRISDRQKERERHDRRLSVELDGERLASSRGIQCKTDGCPNVANTRYDRGIFAGLCEEQCMPARREQASREAAALHDRHRQESGADRERPTGWTAEAIVVALRAWAEEHGRSPHGSEWRAADPHGRRPTASTVRGKFPSWDAALEAAGLAPVYPRPPVELGAPVPDTDPIAANPTLGDVAEELEAAWEELQAADDRWMKACEAFAKHPVLDDIAANYGSDWLLAGEWSK